MSDTIIQLENLSKYYRLGTIGTGSFRQDLQRWWTTTVHRRDDPFFRNPMSPHDPSRLVALDNVSFDIKQGEVWGLIGSNGAGKSTLLKIISRITRPSKGVIRGKGTISSLLEVGTGFHMELTGRENIYISGHMLGMKKVDIQRKFDEIIAFSGIEKFIDTPAKRYSSGMYMRLAFAVAAHLEPDILIVDEVLAVGDAEFQKKCLGKMQEVAHDKGRTILFVSHNMQAVNNLCQKSVWLQHGRVNEIGETRTVVSKFLATLQQNSLQQSWEEPADAPGNKYVRIKHVELIPQFNNGQTLVDVCTPLKFRFSIWNFAAATQLSLSLQLFTNVGECVFDIPTASLTCNEGILEGECTIPGNFLNDGAYYLSLRIIKDTNSVLFDYQQCLSFEVEDYRENTTWFGKWPGIVRPAFPFTWRQTLVNQVHQ
ncbi:ABC transporter ATP-binding protein [Spirosoma endbachense]|uniref:ATP-binding cassette domain-containing protein n=1 Tax=Spirosoma endbachense TaxID=2666025 RepID=A0A6P1VXF7_9BACT|nr:ABC transporter ATP-binding protein [Spirosoma endbachense]QHV97445.1 ATP-binding cassette domain-containing protein [Spirosoma endbachense]